jgi:hypothetical protein
MIDTDKYEGHTTDWEWKDIGVSLAICSNGEAICFDTPDGNLAQDAPKLLEEVKRLREGLQKIVSDFETKKTDKWRMLNHILVILKGDD